MSHNKIYFGLFLVIFIAIAAMIIVWKSQKNPMDKIQTFDDCVKAGYPVLTSYPEQCTAPGRTFVKQVVPEK